MTASKPREWWINKFEADNLDLGFSKISVAECPHKDDIAENIYIHVTEYSAYEKLKAENARLEERCIRLSANEFEALVKCERLQKQLGVAVKIMKEIIEEGCGLHHPDGCSCCISEACIAGSLEEALDQIKTLRGEE